MEKDAEKAKEIDVSMLIKSLDAAQEILFKKRGQTSMDLDIIRGLILGYNEALSQARSEGYEKGKDEYRKSKWVDIIWNEAIEEARKVAEEHKSTDGECPESIANAEGYRTAVSQIAESIQRLKRG